MGYMRHHMIVVTTYDERLIQQAHAKATEIFGRPNRVGVHMCVTPIVVSSVNQYYSFFVPTDGSKEGWSDSDDGDQHRAQFIAWLESQRYEDQSSPFKWAEVQYGDEQRDNRVLHHDGLVEPRDPDEQGV